MCDENKTEPARDPIHGMKEKLYAEQIRSNPARQQAEPNGAMIGGPPRPLRDRAERKHRLASERVAREHNDVLRLIELRRLLDDNPAIARILELIEQTGV